jgi:hypothetical protein
LPRIGSSSLSYPIWVATAVLDKGISDAAELVERLVDSQLVKELREDELGQACYGFRDLLRLVAREEVEADQGSPAALTRGLRVYLAAGQRADAFLTPKSRTSPGASPASDISDELLQDPIRWS